MKVTLVELNQIGRKHERLKRAATAGETLPVRTSGRRRMASSGRTPLRVCQEKQEMLMQTCREFVPVFEKSFDFPHLVVLANADGEILQRWGDGDSILKAARDGLQPGERYNLANRGVNAFSAAMELSRPVFLERNEHRVHALANWNAFVFPIHGPGKKADGFVGFLFSDMPHAPGVGPFLHAIAMRMEREYETRCKSVRGTGQPTLEERLSRFGLTARECQVASYWVLDYDYKQISKAIGISENTVRVIVGRINGKLKVNSKASMILRLFDAI